MMKKTITLLLSCLLISACSQESQTPTLLEVDTLIVNGLVYSGDIADPQTLAVGITDDTIVFVGDTTSQAVIAQQTIDADGMMVLPGFIDPHTHSAGDLKSTDRNANLNYLTQGVTTVFNGNDGGGSADIAAQFGLMEKQGIGTNVALFVGHGDIREQVMGRDNRDPTPEEMESMKALVDSAMDEGALGLSTGLFYVPDTYSTTAEVVELAKVAAAKGGIYESHIRDESNYNIGVKAAIAELLQIGREAKIPVHIAHIKALGVDVWGQSADIIKMVEEAQQNGQAVTADQYPWRASGTGLHKATVPSWALAGSEAEIQARFKNPELMPEIRAAMTENIRRRGGPDSLLIVTALDEALLGKTIADLSKQWSLDPVDTVLKVLALGVNNGGARVASFNMSPDDIANFMVQPWVMTSSDGTNGHPRKYASFPTKYRHYVLEKSLMDVPTFVHRSSAQVAETFGIKNRGYIKPGYFADISIIDSEQFKPAATFREWNQLTPGVIHQWVNGVQVINNGEYTGALPGRGLRKGL
ncbi:amidohydrolase family protein [bacterium SCSIO 12696]|nr:amidohydrolase family protein [bacterium SCSIO 12696]